MKKEAIIVTFLFLLTIPYVKAGILANLEVNKEELRIGDILKIDLNINNNYDEEIPVTIIFYFEKEDLSYSNMPSFVEDILNPDEEKTINLLTLPIRDYMRTGTYVSRASIYVHNVPVANLKKEINISTLDEFNINIIICKDKDCKQKSKIFLINEDMYIDYFTDVTDLSIKANLAHPNGNVNQINIPSIIHAEQIGAYILEITASKPGYRTITKKEQFAVIKEHLKIPKRCEPSKSPYILKKGKLEIKELLTTYNTNKRIYLYYGTDAENLGTKLASLKKEDYWDIEESSINSDSILSVGFDGVRSFEEQIITLDTNQGKINIYLPELITTSNDAKLRLYVAEDGSTYYNDANKDGTGTRYDFEEAVNKGLLARAVPCSNKATIKKNIPRSTGFLTKIVGWVIRRVTQHID